MAVSSSGVYAKGSFFDSDQDWYHGQLTRAEAEQALRAAGHDCFLIRESKGALVLSLVDKGRFCHLKIEYGTGWYKLDLQQPPVKFTGMNQMLSYYQSQIISDKLKVTLGEVCKKGSITSIQEPKIPGDSDIYAKATPSVRNEAWYHGDVSRVEAEQVLAASGNNCFLIRESGKSLVLSLIHHGQVHHVNIQYGPGWYKLESSSAPKFIELERLVSYYKASHISDDIKVRLDVACETKGTTTPNLYSKGEPTDLLKYVWFHGNVSKDQAIQELQAMKKDAFLVRQDGSDLILSTKVAQDISHQIIHRYSGGYGLEGRDREFASIPELITHYQQFPCGDRVLGAECARPSSAEYDVISTDPTKYQWYHDSITEEQALVILKGMNENRFLIRSTEDSFILSCQLSGYIYHFSIQHDQSGYFLEFREERFQSIPDLVTHYQKVPSMIHTQLLGTACNKADTELILKEYATRLNEKAKFDKTRSVLEVKWSKCADIPIPISNPRLVKIGGHIYVGGGMPGVGKLSYYIYKYDLNHDTWDTLPHCPTQQHSLATLDDELIVIGGLLGRDIANTVYTFRQNKWLEELPPMPTPRYHHSSITHENKVIIAAGGIVSQQDTGKYTRSDVVEIYIKGDQWYSTKPLPFPSSSFSLCIIQDSCYISGGSAQTFEQQLLTVYTTVASLIKNAEPADSRYSAVQCPLKWGKFKGAHPMRCTTLAVMNGKLFSLGGTDFGEMHVGTTFFSTYDFASDTWVECKGAELPVPLYRSTVMNLGNNEVICVGGQPKSQQFSAEVFIGSYNFVQ